MNMRAISNQDTPLEKELKKLKEQGTRVVNAGINRLFDLKPKSARRRMQRILFLLVLIGFAISLRPHPLGEWIDQINRIINLINQGDPIGSLNSVIEFVNLGLQAYINPHTLWYFPAFFLPIIIAHQAASFYLADVFELEHIGTARKFIFQVALTGSNDVIRITNGEILQEHLESPIFRIGGPGKVIVDLDSVVLFEKADGRPNIFGPTGKKTDGKADLEGFERIRKVLDLRDQFVDLRGMDGKFSAVKSRSLDGINITATDVRLMFSIDRGDQDPTNELPYPYSEKAVKRHIYKSVSQVTSQIRGEQSIPKLNFEGAIISMVRRELGRFMSQRNLTDYLASINFPEILRAEELENVVVEEARQVLEPIESAEGVRRPVAPRPNFVPRHEITNLFSQFAEEFTSGATDKGVKLHWIGIGTWKVPDELVSERHLEAWKISHENAINNSDRAIAAARVEARIQKILSLIQDVPLGVFQEEIVEMVDRNAAIRRLCLEYRKQINENFEQLRTRGRRVPPSLVATLYLINRMFWNFVPPPAPPPPATPEEDRLYRELLDRIGFWEVIEQLVGIERGTTPNASREEIYRKINADWEMDIVGNWDFNARR